MKLNPYNSTKPGNLFTGYGKQRLRILNGLNNGKSFAVMGGRRCGKTSLLLQLEKDLGIAISAQQALLPRFVDIQAELPKSAEEFWACVSRFTVEGTHLPILQPGHNTQPYQAFLAWLSRIALQMTELNSANWMVMLLLDELEVAASRLPNDDCFHNLRNFLIKSESPLNNLESHTLWHLSVDESHQLVQQGFGNEFPPQLESNVAGTVGLPSLDVAGLAGVSLGCATTIGRGIFTERSKAVYP